MQEQKHPTFCRSCDRVWTLPWQGAGKALGVDKLSLSNMSLLSLRAIRSDLHFCQEHFGSYRWSEFKCTGGLT